jgi:hypothetical protein
VVLYIHHSQLPVVFFSILKFGREPDPRNEKFLYFTSSQTLDKKKMLQNGCLERSGIRVYQ